MFQVAVPMAATAPFGFDVLPDRKNDSDIVAMIAASAAITISGLPFMGPLGAAKVGMKDGKLIVNPTLSDLKNSTLEVMKNTTGCLRNQKKILITFFNY